MQKELLLRWISIPPVWNCSQKMHSTAGLRILKSDRTTSVNLTLNWPMEYFLMHHVQERALWENGPTCGGSVHLKSWKMPLNCRKSYWKKQEIMSTEADV